MSFISTGFLLFVFVVALINRLVSTKKSYIVLLVASLAFYSLGGAKALCYILATSFVVYIASCFMQKIQDKTDTKLLDIKHLPLEPLDTKGLDTKAQKKAIKQECKKQKKLVLGVSLLFCFGVLAVLKYFNFFASNLFAILGTGTQYKSFSFFVPLGLSFYTFSAAGYLIDIYNAKYPVQRNFFKFLLCVSYFPSIVQGPINRFNDLQEQFFSQDKKPVSLRQVQFALQRILWGMLKKLVIADRAAQVVKYIFSEYKSLPNFIVLGGLVLYSIQLYADFAGGIDVALGTSELLGVKLKENFRQPYFSGSIAEFWRRWHITLGTWMKDYVFYPLSLSPFMTKFAKILPSKYLKRTLPVALSNITVFLLVGIWHGAAWHFVLYGLFHGGIIAFSVLAQPLYQKLIAFFGINVKSFLWRGFRIIRTFYLVCLSALFDDVTDLGQSFGMTKQLFSFSNWSLIKNFSFSGFGKLTLLVIAIFCAIWFFVSVIQEKGLDIRQEVAKKPLVIRWLIYLSLVLIPAFFQSSHMAGFMYAMF